MRDGGDERSRQGSSAAYPLGESGSSRRRVGTRPLRRVPRDRDLSRSAVDGRVRRPSRARRMGRSRLGVTWSDPGVAEAATRSPCRVGASLAGSSGLVLAVLLPVMEPLSERGERRGVGARDRLLTAALTRGATSCSFTASCFARSRDAIVPVGGSLRARRRRPGPRLDGAMRRRARRSSQERSDRLRSLVGARSGRVAAVGSPRRVSLCSGNPFAGGVLQVKLAETSGGAATRECWGEPPRSSPFAARVLAIVGVVRGSLAKELERG